MDGSIACIQSKWCIHRALCIQREAFSVIVHLARDRYFRRCGFHVSFMGAIQSTVYNLETVKRPETTAEEKVSRGGMGPLVHANKLLTDLSPFSGWGCSSAGRASDRHAAEAGSILRCGEEFFSQSQLSVQTLLRVSVQPSCALTYVGTFKIPSIGSHNFV